MSMTEAATAPLRTVSFFARLPQRELERVAGRTRLVRFERGEAIVSKGDRSCRMYIVLSGQARVEVGGRYHEMASGDLLGEMSVLSSKPRIATVRAAQALEAAEIDCGDIETFLTENPTVAVQMLKILAERLREVEQRLDAWMGLNVS